jgi:hypothetical protein
VVFLGFWLKKMVKAERLKALPEQFDILATLKRSNKNNVTSVNNS